MTGYNQFIDIFGEITLLQVVEIIVAIIFLFAAYRKGKDYLVKKHDLDKQRDSELKEALEAARNQPKYRAQSIEIQKELKSEIAAISKKDENTSKRLDEVIARLDKMEETSNRRDRNAIRDNLLKHYRYYTNPETNPDHSWTKMEADAFWEQFRDYEDAGGDGQMHTIVQPAMMQMKVIDE